ncbi:hypothetical protein D3C84_869820 [compost metagenome]
MAVVAADVVLLGRGAVQQAAGLHEELLDPYVGWQAVLMQVGQVIQFGIVAEDPFDKGFEEALLQTVAQVRPAQAQGRVNGQLSLGQLCNAPVQRVGEQVGFAQPQGHAEMNMRGQALEHVIHRLFD